VSGRGPPGPEISAGTPARSWVITHA
jgi:hypothetical protein